MKRKSDLVGTIIVLCSLTLLPLSTLAKSSGSYWQKKIISQTKYVDDYFEQDKYGREKINIFFGDQPIATVSSGELYFNLADHLGSTSLLTDQDANIVETNDYNDFGQLLSVDSRIRNNDKFLGQELDRETNLSYFINRYYDSHLARFMSMDPASMVVPLQLLLDPQQLNTYSYARNNPISNLDPSGLLTIIVPGTNYNSDAWSDSGGASSFIKNFGNTFNEKPTVINDTNVWSGGDNARARQRAAEGISGMIKGYQFATDEALNIIGFSHGGNIGVLISQMIDRKIDNLVTLGTPVRSDYQPNYNIVANHINVYSSLDLIQSGGGNGSSLSEIVGRTLFGNLGGRIGRRLAWGEFGVAGRKFDGAENIEVTKQTFSLNPLRLHTNMWRNNSIWNLVSSHIK